MVKENKCWNVEARKRRIDAVSDEIKKKEEHYYFSEEVSREMPTKKETKSQEGTPVYKYIMTIKLHEAFSALKKK